MDENEKVGARNNRNDAARLQQIHDYAVENGAMCQTRSLPDNAMKAISMTEDEYRIGNYIVLYGGRDLTGIVHAKNKDGSSGEYFSENTVLESDYTKTGKLHMDFEHGKDPDETGIGKHDLLGYVDWQTAKADERGVFVQRVLNRRKKYVKWLEPLIEEGLIGNSSEAIPDGVEKSDSGEITRWPLIRDTLTVNPMEPRMLSKNAVMALKALGKGWVTIDGNHVLIGEEGDEGGSNGIIGDGDIKMGIHANVGFGGLRIDTASVDDEDRQWFSGKRMLEEYDIPQTVKDNIANRMKNEVYPIYKERMNTPPGTPAYQLLLTQESRATDSARDWANSTYNWKEYRRAPKALHLDILIPPNPAALPAVEDKTKSILAGVTKMTEQVVDVKALLDAEFAKRDAALKVEADKAAALKTAEEAGYQKAVEEIRGKKVAFNTVPLGFEKDASMGFKHWLKTGAPNGALIPADGEWGQAIEDNAKNMRDGAGKAVWAAGSDSGAYLVPDPLYNQIIAKRDNASWVRQVPVQTFQTSSDHILVPVEGTAMSDFVLTAEKGTYDENEATATQVNIIMYKFTKEVKITEEFINYNSVNFDSWLTTRLADAAAGAENNYFTNGTGSSQPQGALYAATVANSALTAVVTPAELATFIGYLPAAYATPSQCAMVMKNATKWSLKAYAGSSFAGFAFIGTPSGGDFLGFKAVVNDDMPACTTTLKPILFGNFSYYGVAERPGMMMQRNPYLYMASGHIGLFSSIYRGGAILQAEALYYLTIT